MRFLGSWALSLFDKFLWKEVDEFLYFLTIERHLFSSSWTSFREFDIHPLHHFLTEGTDGNHDARKNDLIGWTRKNNRVARVVCSLV